MSRGSGRVRRECWRAIDRYIFIAGRIEYGRGWYLGP